MHFVCQYDTYVGSKDRTRTDNDWTMMTGNGDEPPRGRVPTILANHDALKASLSPHDNWRVVDGPTCLRVDKPFFLLVSGYRASTFTFSSG